MATVSLCMIVKNEEKVLKRCLDSLADLMDEIIIVDTGSTDHTREIAAEYTDRIYDFAWVDDFSAARNFAFSKCSMDYIYSADADEVLDETNRRRFQNLMAAILPEVEIVQMHYVESLHTVMNVTSEYRPKLFKRLRTFTWVDPVHETVRTLPVVFDSDIEILHRPVGLHSKRDFSLFEKAYARDHYFSDNLYFTYVKELLKWGDASDLAHGAEIFDDIILNAELTDQELVAAAMVLARAARLIDDGTSFMKYALAITEDNNCSEIQLELGHWFLEHEDYGQAAVCYQRAAFDTEPLLDVHAGGDLPLVGLAKAYEHLGDRETALQYKEAAADWQMPEE